MVKHHESELCKTIKIGNIDFKPLIDLGSKCSTMSLCECREQNWEIEGYGITLTVYAGGECRTLGHVVKNIEIGEVEQVLKVSIVGNYVQQMPVIIGQDFLSRPWVKMVKT